MTYTIADAKTKYFKDKDHYLAMRKAFAKSVNDPNIDLHGYHFMFYNALRGKDLRCGFRDRTNLKQIYHQGWLNYGVYKAQYMFHLKPRRDINDIIFPFGDTVSVDVAEQVIADMPRIPNNVVSVNKTRTTYEQWIERGLTDALVRAAERLIANSKPLPADAVKVLYDNIWDLYVY